MLLSYGIRARIPDHRIRLEILKIINIFHNKMLPETYIYTTDMLALIVDKIEWKNRTYNYKTIYK